MCYRHLFMETAGETDVTSYVGFKRRDEMLGEGMMETRK